MVFHALLLGRRLPEPSGAFTFLKRTLFGDRAMSSRAGSDCHARVLCGMPWILRSICMPSSIRGHGVHVHVLLLGRGPQEHRGALSFLQWACSGYMPKGGMADSHARALLLVRITWILWATVVVLISIHVRLEQGTFFSSPSPGLDLCRCMNDGQLETGEGDPQLCVFCNSLGMRDGDPVSSARCPLSLWGRERILQVCCPLFHGVVGVG